MSTAEPKYCLFCGRELDLFYLNTEGETFCSSLCYTLWKYEKERAERTQNTTQ